MQENLFFRILLITTILHLSTSNLYLYIDSINGKQIKTCSSITTTLCTKTSPCQLLSCALQFANASLTHNKVQNVQIILITPISNPLANNYTLLGSLHQNWLSFTGYFKLIGSIQTPLVNETTCMSYPVLSLQNFMKDTLYIDASDGVIFEYLNIQVLLAYQPIKIYNYDFSMENICIGMNMSASLNLASFYKAQANSSYQYIQDYPWYKIIFLQTGTIDSGSLIHPNYAFTNIMISYDGYEYPFCDNLNMPLLYSDCEDYLFTGLIEHNIRDYFNIPRLNFTNLQMECTSNTYIKFFYSRNSSHLTVNNLNTNCLPSFEITADNVNISNINLIGNNQLNYFGQLNNAATVLDITAHGIVYVQNVTIMNYQLGVCYDFEYCHMDTVEPISIISIYDVNKNITTTMSTGSARLLQVVNDSEANSLNVGDFTMEIANMDDNIGSSAVANVPTTTTRTITNTTSTTRRSRSLIARIITSEEEEEVEEEEEEEYAQNIPPATLPNLTMYSDILWIPDEDSETYSCVYNREFPNASNIMTTNANTITFINVTIASNTLNPNSDDRFFSFIYVSSSLQSSASTYTIQDVNYSNNSGINAYQHYGFTLHDAQNYLINNINYTYNNISRLLTMKSTLKSSISPIVIISNIDISYNGYSMINPNSYLYDPNGVDDGSMGIIDFTCFSNSLTYGLSNITIQNNILEFAMIITIQNTAIFDDFVPVYTYISDINMSNNQLVSTSLLNIQGSNAYINNLNSVNDFIEITSLIDLGDQENQFNALVLQNSTFYNLSLYQSYLIQKDADYASDLIILDLIAGSKILPFWLTISNCTFENLIIDDNSIVIEFTFMPFAFIYNNTFSNLTISHHSSLISGNKFVNKLRVIPGISNHVPDILTNQIMLDQYTSQIFQASINLTTGNGPYSDLEINYYNEDGEEEEEEEFGEEEVFEEEEEEVEEGDDKEEEEEVVEEHILITSVFVTRIMNNIFDDINTYLSDIIALDTCQTNIMLISIDHNILTNINISTPTYNLIKFDDINLIGIAYNYFNMITGNGNTFRLTGHTNAKIYNNYLTGNNGPSLLRIMGNNARQTFINQNIIKDVNISFTYIYFFTQYNEGQIIFNNNIFFNIVTKADIYTYQSINFIYIEISNADIMLSNLDFDNNTFANIQFIKNHTLIKQFQNSFIFISNPDDIIEFADSILYNISILYDNNLLAIVSQYLFMKNTTLSLIYNYENWGSLYFLGFNLYIIGCSFQFNYAYNGYGGAIFVDYDKINNSNTTVNIKSTVFRNNFALMGAAFYYGGGGRSISFIAEENDFYQGNISLFDMQYIPQDLTLVNGIMAFDQAMLFGEFSIKSTTLYSKDNTNGFVFFIFSNLVGNIWNSQNTISSSSLYMDTNNDTFSAIYIINCSDIQFIFHNITIQVDGVNFNPVSLLTADSGNIIISNVNLDSLAGYGPFIELMCNSPVNASIMIIQSTFSNFFVPILSSSFGIVHISSNGLSHECFQKVNITQSIFNQTFITAISDWTQDFSAVYVDYLGNLSMAISQTIFQNMTSIRGPAINLNNWQTASKFEAFNGLTINSMLPVTAGNSSFVNSSSIISSLTNNEAVMKTLQDIYYFYDTEISIDECEFISNTAYLEGGAIYNTYNNLSITNSSFIYNQAQYRTGAAIFSINFPILTTILNISSNNNFTSNNRYSQKYFGLYTDQESLGSPPISMNLSINQSSNSYVNIQFFSSNNTFLITNVTTYDLKLLTFTIGLIDGLGQSFYESPNGDIELDPSLKNTRSVRIFTNSSLGDSSNCDFVNCYVINTTLVLRGKAGSLVPVNFSYNSNENIVLNVTINTILRSCMVGEINSSNIAGGDPYQSICTLCLPNSYSLLLNDSNCNPCDFEDAASCLGGSNIYINPGFWRNNTLSNLIISCPNDLACLGGINSDCAYGYNGPLCQSCNGTARYARSGPNKCGLCPGKFKQVLVSILFITAMVAYQIYTIKTTLMENMAFYESGMTPDKEKAKTQGQYIRLLTTYAQIITIVLSFQLQYPDFVQQTVGPAATAAGSPTNSIFASTLCLLIDLGYEPDKITFYKIILACGIPLVKIILICSGLFIIFRTWKKNMYRTLKKAYYMISIVCIVLIEQPGLFNNLVSYLTCIQINNEGPYYLLSDYGVQCYTLTYNFYLMFIVLPSIIIWGFLIPGILLFVLYKYRNKLNNKLLRLNLGGIYNEYTSSAYFWGIVLMVTKLILMLAAAVLYNDVKTEALTIFIILYIYFFAHEKVKPIQKEEIYKAEQMATATYLITIFFAIYYKGNRYELGLLFAIVVIAIANFYVIGLIIYKIIMLNSKYIPCLKKYVAAQDAALQKEIDNVEQGVDNGVDFKVKVNEDQGKGKLAESIEIELQSIPKK